MSEPVKAQASTLCVAQQSAWGTYPTSGFHVVQPNPGTLTGWKMDGVFVERNPQSKNAMPEKGDLVGVNATPSLGTDVNKDSLMLWAGAMLKCVPKEPCSTGQSLYRPTSVTTTAYVVPTNGAVPAGYLLFAEGFTLAANNGLKVVDASSDTDELKTSGLAAETNPANARVWIVGFQGGSGELTIDTDGNLNTSGTSFVTLGIVAGMELKIGNPALGAAYAFATSTYNGTAIVESVSATKVTFKSGTRSWTVGSADTGTSKTVQVFMPRWFRNVPLGHADFLEPPFIAELEDIGAGPSAAASYKYALNMKLASWTITAPLENKITLQLNFIASNVEDPVLVGSRRSGPSTAYDPQAVALIDTSVDLDDVSIYSASAELEGEVNEWSITGNLNASALKSQGRDGLAFGVNYGTVNISSALNIYWTNHLTPAALRSNTDLHLRARAFNHQFGFGIYFPNSGLRGGDESRAENAPIMTDFEMPAFRDQTFNFVMGLSVFGYFPPNA